MTYLIEALPSDGEGTLLERGRELALTLIRRLTDANTTVAHHASGAPYLPEHPSLNVSISHCRSAVAVAISDTGKVGIDVECRRKINQSLVERVCSDAELAWIREAEDPEMAFLQLWTRKEAILKCMGTGIHGFESLVKAADTTDCIVEDVDCEIDDTVASLAMEKQA